jgi:twinkle protein
MEYLVIERRLDPRVVAANYISDTMGGEVVVFPYIDEATKKAAHMKFLKVDRGPDGKKTMWSSKDTKRCLFSKHTITDDCHSIIITEGEIDALSWQSLSFPAVSIPMGVKDTDWIDIDWDWLARFETIYLSMDNDGPGEEAIAVLVKRLGVHRCRIVRLPKKDMNKCLQDGMSREQAQECLSAAKAIELAEIQSPTAYGDKVWKIFNPDGDDGYDTPWHPKLPFRIRPGEFTVLSGYDGAGKTAAINHLILRLLEQGARVLDCSLEIKPERTLQWMAKQALCKRRPDSRQELDAVLEWMAGGIWIFDYVGTADMARMFEAMLYAVKRHGVNVIFIDSLFKCGIGSDDYNAQKDFVAKLCDFCRDTGVHVFLVAHTRKPPVNTGGRNEDRVPSKDEISGSGDIKNAAFNILIIWRNKAKHNKLDELREKGSTDFEAIRKLEEQPDGRMRLDKNRMEGIEREICLWYHPDSTQFRASREELPRPFFKYNPNTQ